MGSEDLISKLPEDVRSQILSRLTIKEAMAMTLLSKAWLDEFVSLPSLNLGEYFFQQTFGTRPVGTGDNSFTKRNLKFLSFVDRILKRRIQLLKEGVSSNNTLLQKFSLFIPRLYSIHQDIVIKDIVDEWLYCVFTNFTVEELDITYSSSMSSQKDGYKLPKNIIIHHAKSLKCLSLTRIKFDQQIIHLIATSCPLITSLSFTDCHALLGSVKNLTINLPTLQSFNYYFDFLWWDDEELVIQIDLKDCNKLKHLRMRHVTWTEGSLDNLIARLLDLQNLELRDCYYPKHVRLSSSSLEHLHLGRNHSLVELDLDTPNLSSFIYRGEDCLPKLKFNSNVTEKITFELLREIKDLRHPMFGDFIGQLHGRSRYFELQTFLYNQGDRSLLHFMDEFPPIYDVKHLTLTYYVLSRREELSNRIFHEVVDPILLIFPRIETLVIDIVHAQKMKLQLKFMYKGEVDGNEICYYCKDQDMQCWRHRLQNVKIENIKGGESHIAPLQNLIEYEMDVTNFRLPSDFEANQELLYDLFGYAEII